MRLKVDTSRYIPLSAPETWQLLSRLTAKGLGPDEAVEQVALVNYIARREHLVARQIVESVLTTRK